MQASCCCGWTGVVCIGCELPPLDRFGAVITASCTVAAMAANHRGWTGAVMTASCTVAANYRGWTGAVR